MAEGRRGRSRADSANSLYIAHGRKALCPPSTTSSSRRRPRFSKAMDYYLHPENLPKVHPNFVKDVKIISTEGDTITLEQHMEMMGRKLKSRQQDDAEQHGAQVRGRHPRGRREGEQDNNRLEGDPVRNRDALLGGDGVRGHLASSRKGRRSRASRRSPTKTRRPSTRCS